MKIRFSRITRSFALAGFTIGLFYVTMAVIEWLGNDAVRTFIYHHFSDEFMIAICPPSLIWLPFANDPSLSDAILVDVAVIAINTLLYAVAGLVISQIYHLIKKVTGPKVA